MAFKLPKLPYSYSALEPYIDKKTMRIHHDKHHAGYVSNLNEAVKESIFLKGKSLDEILKSTNKLPISIKQKVINNAGGHANHMFFWDVMTPKSSKKPEGKFLEVLEANFGGFDTFKEKFTHTAMNVFGSGWAFLILDKKIKVRLKKHSFQNSPIMDGNVPILGLDVWEHAYYLKYQNKRADYIKAWWNVINWKEVEKNYNKALKLLS